MHGRVEMFRPRLIFNLEVGTHWELSPLATRPPKKLAMLLGPSHLGMRQNQLMTLLLLLQ